jgi:hypothetical protein
MRKGLKEARIAKKRGVFLNMPEAILFENANFHGRHKHVFGPEPNLNAPDDNYFNDKVSSFVILDGNWSFYGNSGFNAPYAPVLGPGLYPSVTAAGIKNDDVSSLQPVTAQPTTHGNPLGGHAILFENANYHGQHKHVFGPEPNLNAADDSFFNDRVSSLVFLRSESWKFYRDAGFNNPYPPVLGPTQGPAGGFIPGRYPVVANVGVKNDDMSSLQPVAGSPTIRPVSGAVGHIILFENANFHGQHKHVFGPEGNLNAPDDNYFNDRVSSFVIFQSVWLFYRNSGFNDQYHASLGPGLYPLVTNFNIQNDDMSSLQPA